MKTNHIFKLVMVSCTLLLAPLFETSGGAALAQAPNTWTQKANFGGTVRDGAFAFSIGTKGYIGGGNNNGSFKNELYEYDPATNAWTQKASVPVNEYLASSFIIGSKAYVACGYNTANAVYEFDPVANTWTTKTPLPGASRYITAGFSIGTKGYCGTGYNPNSPYNSFNDFYELDPVANTWTAKANIPGSGRAYAVGFNLGTKGYIGAGLINGNAVNDFYEYDPTGNAWTAKANIGPVGRLQSFGIAVNGKGYVGGGGQGNDPSGFYEYDATADTWTVKANIPVARAGAVAFGIGTKLYIGTGGDPFDNNYNDPNYYYRNDFYEWNSCGPTLTISPASAFLCNSGSVALTASGASTYTWSHGGANGSVVTPTITTHYTVTGVNTGTCPATNSAVVTVVVSNPAANQTIAPATTTFVCNGSTNLNLTTEAGVNYYLRNDANSAVLAGPYTGTGSTLTIPTGNLSTTTTFNINAKRTSGGLTFDGVDDEIRTAGGGVFNFAGDFTMETWIKSPIGANGGTKVIIGQPGNTDLWLGFVNDGNANFALGGNGGNSIADTKSINDGKWHHLAAVRSSGTKSLYVDGVLVGTQTNANTVSANSFLEVGSYAGAYNFKGQIDEVRIFNVALTQPQVAASMTNCITGSETGLVLYYNFEDGAGSTTVTDLAGLDNNATQVNMNAASAWSYGVENCIACAATQMTTKPVVTIVPISNQVLTTVNPNICVSGTGTITTPGSDANIDYLLRDNSNNAVVSGPVAGTGSALSFTTGTISSTKTYNVFARSQTAYLDFDGANDYVSSTSTVGVPGGGSPYTVEALIKPDAINNPQGTVVGWGNYGNPLQANGFRINGSGQVINYWSANDLAANVGNLMDGAWHHMAATYDGTIRSIYFDGVLVGFDTPGTPNVSVINNMSIGAAINTSNNPYEIYKGGIDEVRVWNIARTQSQIIANMNSSLLGSESGLSVYYKFTDGVGSTTAKDFAGDNNTGTLTNMNAATAWNYYSAPCSLQMSNTATVTINALPTVSVNSPSVCSGYSVALVPSGAATYTITGGAFNVSPTANTSYSVTGTSSVGCVSSNTAVSNVAVVASPTISVNNPTICSGNPVAIVPTGASASYTITGNDFIVTPLTTTVYSVTGTNSNGCVSLNSGESTVNVITTPTLSVNSGSMCSNNSFVIIPSGANTYTVSGGSFTISPLTTTSYSVTGTGTNGCISASPAVSTVTVFATPTLAVNSATICSGNSAAIVPAGANTYTISGNSFTVTPLTTTNYSVTGTSTAGCISSNTAVASVSVNATPTIAVNSGSICSNNSFVILPSGATTYTITGGNYTVSPLTTTSYSVAGTGTNGCVTAFNAVSHVTVYASPTLAVNSGSICSGQSFTVTPLNAGTYTITGGNFIVNPLTTTSYSVTGTSTAGCAAINTIVSAITVFATPTLAVNSATICSGLSVAIVAAGANTYSITGNNFNVTPLTTTSYSVTGTSTAGCISANPAVSQVSVNATPTIAVNSGSICTGKSFTITPSGASTYTISGNNFIVTPLNTTSYPVTGTGTNGCVSASFVVSQVTVFTTPTVAVNSGSICSGTSFSIVPSGAATYTISGGNFNVSPLLTASYSVTGTSTAGCITANTVTSTVTVFETPTVMVNNAAVCSGNSAVITPSGADTYNISGGTFTVNPSTTTSYTVSGTSTEGCVSADAVTEVTVNALPVLAVSGSTHVCAFSTTSLTASGASNYTWNEGTVDATIAVTASVNTTYTVTGTDANGCTNVSVVSIIADPCLGINQNKAALIFGVYPNPNHGEFVVETAENAEVVVLNSLGQMIHSEKTASEKTTVSIDHLANGIYFVKVIANGNQQTVKIIKE